MTYNKKIVTYYQNTSSGEGDLYTLNKNLAGSSEAYFNEVNPDGI
jgi:hypothetical protein